MAAKAKATTKPPVEKRWAEIDRLCKPSKAASKDRMRPQIECGYIVHRKQQTLLCMTDSFVLVEIPVHLDVPFKERKKWLPEVALVPHVLKALDRSKTGKFRINNGLIEVEGEPMLYPVNTEFKALNFASLWPEKSGEDEIASIGVNPMHVQRAAEAMGITGKGGTHAIKAKFIAPLRPIVIEPLMATGARGLVMPVRLAEDQ